MDQLRILNALRNKAGQVLNSILPPKTETFCGIGNHPIHLILCSSRWQYKSRFAGDGYEYTKFVPGLKNLVDTVHFVPIEIKDSIVKTIHSLKYPNKMNVVLSVFQRIGDIPADYFQLSENGFNLLNWYTDDDMFFDVFSKQVARNFNLNITTYEPNLPLYTKLGSRAIASQWAGLNGCSFREHRRYAACFIGRMYGQRSQMSKALKREFGERIFFHDTRLKPIREEAMISAYQNSWLAIDEPMAYDRRTQQIKARIFENASMGCLVLTKPNARLSNYYVAGREILFWQTIPELIATIQNCIDKTDLYKEMARLAYRRTLKEHLYEHRFARIFEYCKVTENQSYGPESSGSTVRQ